MTRIELENGDALNGVDSIEVLREMMGRPTDGAIRKDIGRIDHNFEQFIALSPFLVLGTASASGACDVSPRGDRPGFVRVLDERHLAIPERPGNRRMDSIENVVETGRAGLIFLIPGSDDTLRVNGRAAITQDAELLHSMAVEGKDPRLAIVVTVEQTFLHCAKAFRRSRLWAAEARLERSALPSAGCMLQEQLALEGVTGEQIDANLEVAIATTLW
jgi:uncharacterized protein